MKKYPFKFLDAYDKEDRKIFFGRDDEIAELYRLVFQTNLLLVYGASGTGKTSLIRCGLANRFKPSQWLDLLIRRGSDINASLLDAIRKRQPRAQSVSLIGQEQENDWFSSLMEADQESGITESESSQIKSQNPVAQALQDLYLATFTPIYLIFDQFEELYTLGNPEEQRQFTRTIAELVKLPLPVRIIIVMREEYLARLYDLERAVPQLRNYKLRVAPMDLPMVEQVILSATVRNPESNIELEQGKEQEIVHTIVDKIREGDISVKLPYLQLFMDRLYEKVTGEATDRSRDAHLNLELVQQMGNIDVVLANFINQQSEHIYRKLAPKYLDLPNDIVWHILSPFATMDGLKVPIKQEDLHQIAATLKLSDTGQADELIKEVVAELETSRILRYRKEEQTYEVVHDTLALQIADKRSEEEKTYLKARRTVTEGFASYQDTKTLLSREQLSFIRPYESRLETEIKTDQQGFITKSKNKRRRQRIGLWAGVVAAFLIAIAVIFIVIKEQQKTKKALETALRTQAAKDALEFKSLESRAALIIKVGGNPIDIVNKMDTLFFNHTDSTRWKKQIDIMRDKIKNHNDFK